MQKVTRGTVTRYAFDYHDKPVIEVELGESFQVETDDALTGMIEDDSDAPTVHRMVKLYVPSAALALAVALSTSVSDEVALAASKTLLLLKAPARFCNASSRALMSMKAVC